jgi:hypothetical protein|tara:strand:+ start:1689 stop:2021 length:333 start_codon:yes stop_codon:yes gene_type:complete
MSWTFQVVNFETRDQTNSEGVVLSDAVVKVKWRRVGIDLDGRTASCVGYTVLSAANCPADQFSAFADLTEEEVTGWLESNMSEDLIRSYDNSIIEKINKTITTKRAKPWS